jgi:serine/threonine-protein kinase SRPK3
MSDFFWKAMDPTRFLDLYTGNVLLQVGNFDSWSEEEVYRYLGTPVKKGIFSADGAPIRSHAPAYIVHPGKLFLLEEQLRISKILIIDFGQAYFLEEPPKKIITPQQFSAPELLYPDTQQEVSAASDRWAVGCIIFKICTGYTLFKALFNPRYDALKDIVAMLGRYLDLMWQSWGQRSRYFDSNGVPIKAGKDAISVKPYSLRARIRNISRLYVTGHNQGMINPKDEEVTLENWELLHLYDLLSEIFIYDLKQRWLLQEAIHHPFIMLENGS